MNTYINKHKRKLENDFRAPHKNETTKYWKLINSLKGKTKIDEPNINEFYDHFKEINISHSSSNNRDYT